MQDIEVVNSNEISPYDSNGNPIPVVIPIEVSNSSRAFFTTRLGGVNDAGTTACNLSYARGNTHESVELNRKAINCVVGRPVMYVRQTHSNVVCDLDEYDENITENLEHICKSDINNVRYEDRQNESNILIHHRNRSECVENRSFNRYAEVTMADALVTSRKDIALGILTADCLPLLLNDPVKGIIAAIHCGRKGIIKGIVQAALQAMQQKGARAEHILAVIGPHICADCYEVGSDIADEFDGYFPGSFALSRFTDPSISLEYAVRSLLLQYGINNENIQMPLTRIIAATQYLQEDKELANICALENNESSLADRISSIHHSSCTYENPLWFSHRRSVHCVSLEGRMASIILQE